MSESQLRRAVEGAIIGMLSESQLRCAIFDVLNNTRRRTTQGIVNEVIDTISRSGNFHQTELQKALEEQQFSDKVYQWCVESTEKWKKENQKSLEYFDKLIQRMREGEDPYDLFGNHIYRETNGIYAVDWRGKENFIDEDGNLLSPNIWFKGTGPFINGYAVVYHSFWCNYIDENGNLLSPNQWFNEAKPFENGFGLVNCDLHTHNVQFSSDWYKIDAKGRISEIDDDATTSQKTFPAY